MRQIYLIILGPDVDKDLLIQCIRDLGDVYGVFGSNVFVSSELDSAQDVYNAIVTDEMGQQTSVVLDLGTEPGYWGYTKRELWSWLETHSVGGSQQ